MLRVWEDMSLKYTQNPRHDRYHEYIEVSITILTNDEKLACKYYREVMMKS